MDKATTMEMNKKKADVMRFLDEEVPTMQWVAQDGSEVIVPIHAGRSEFPSSEIEIDTSSSRKLRYMATRIKFRLVSLFKKVIK